MTREAKGDIALAETLLDAGQAERAKDAALRALASNPHDPHARLLLAQALLELHETEEAIAHLRSVIAEQPGNANAFRVLSEACLGTPEPYDGLRFAKIAMRLEPQAWQSHTTLAAAEAVVRGRPGSDRALAAARRAIEIAPHIAETHNCLGRVYVIFGRYRRAEAAFRVALSIDPNDPVILSNLGLALEGQGKAAAAMNMFANLVGSRPAEREHAQKFRFVARRWILIFAAASIVWGGVAVLWMCLALRAYPDDDGARITYFAVVTLIPLIATIAGLTFIARFRHDLRSLVAVIRAELPLYAITTLFLTVMYALLIAVPFFPTFARDNVMIAAALELIGAATIGIVAIIMDED